MAEGNRNKAKTEHGGCLWCGEPVVNTRNHGSDRDSVNICAKCENLRDNWLLKCIRASEHPAKYVARVETREAIGRKEREIKASAKHAPTAPPPVLTESDAWVARVEKMLTSLMQQLGS